jgi:streptogramin lyase
MDSLESIETSQILMAPAPEPTMLMREYRFPIGPATTAVFQYHPSGITHDKDGYIWATDIPNDKIYRLTPASSLNDTSTDAMVWHLPSGWGGWKPTHIVTDTDNHIVWFCCPGNQAVCRLNWLSHQMDVFSIGFLGLYPWDLVLLSNGLLWFTCYNSTTFCMLNQTNFLHTYTFSAAVGAPQGCLTEIDTDDTHLYMTDFIYNNLYETVWNTVTTTGVDVYPLEPNGGSLCVDHDSQGNVWVTQPQNELINEQLAGSSPKFNYNIEPSGWQLNPPLFYLNQTQVNVTITLTTIAAAQYERAPTIKGDPLAIWSVPTNPSKPWGLVIDYDDYAWFTEPGSNQIGVINPLLNQTWEYPLPTPWAGPAYLTVPENEHIWFTEYTIGAFGEIFTDTFTDIRVCPSIPPHYPPPPPGSIRWTHEPGAEIWVDAPGNGYDPTHHDIPQLSATNRLYARVKNMGSTTATNIVVRFYAHNMSLGFGSWIPLPPANPDPMHWTLIDTYVISSLAAGTFTDVFVDWVLPASAPTHQCIGVQVVKNDDINLYDNVAYRNFAILYLNPGVFQVLNLSVWITNTDDSYDFGDVNVIFLQVPRGWNAHAEPNQFQLAQGASQQISLMFDVPATVQPGFHGIIHVIGNINGQDIGHIWIELKALQSSSISVAVLPTSVEPGQAVSIRGALTPTLAGAQVYVHITKPSGITYQLGALTDTNGSYAVATSLNDEVGAYSVYAYWYGDSTYSGATSVTQNYSVIILPIPTWVPNVLMGFAVGIVIMIPVALLCRKRSG